MENPLGSGGGVRSAEDVENLVAVALELGEPDPVACRQGDGIAAGRRRYREVAIVEHDDSRYLVCPARSERRSPQRLLGSDGFGGELDVDRCGLASRRPPGTVRG